MIFLYLLMAFDAGFILALFIVSLDIRDAEKQKLQGKRNK